MWCRTNAVRRPNADRRATRSPAPAFGAAVEANEVDLPALLHGTASPVPVMGTLAQFKFEAVAGAGSTVAASSEFVSYAVPGGLIRVIWSSPFRTFRLLRGHEGSVLDMHFSPSQPRWLASTALDGQLILWLLSADMTLGERIVKVRARFRAYLVTHWQFASLLSLTLSFARACAAGSDRGYERRLFAQCFHSCALAPHAARHPGSGSGQQCALRRYEPGAAAATAAFAAALLYAC